MVAEALLDQKKELSRKVNEYEKRLALQEEEHQKVVSGLRSKHAEQRAIASSEHGKTEDKPQVSEALQSKISQLVTQISQLEEEKRSLQQDNIALNGQLSELSSKLGDLEADRNAVAGRAEESSSQCGEQAKKICELQETLYLCQNNLASSEAAKGQLQKHLVESEAKAAHQKQVCVCVCA